MIFKYEKCNTTITDILNDLDDLYSDLIYYKDVPDELIVINMKIKIREDMLRNMKI